MSNLLSEVHALELQNKITPTPTISDSLSKLRDELQSILPIDQYNKHLRRLKLSYYAHAFKAGKYLTNRIKILQARSRISHLIHPTFKAVVNSAAPALLINSVSMFKVSNSFCPVGDHLGCLLLCLV